MLDGPEEAVELLQEKGAIFEARVDDVEVLKLGRRSLSRTSLRVWVEGEDDAPARARRLPPEDAGEGRGTREWRDSSGRSLFLTK